MVEPPARTSKKEYSIVNAKQTLAGLCLLALAGATQAQTPWYDSVKLKGDARFRYQSTDEEGKDVRERWRFRGRISADAKVNDEVDIGLRLVTNTGDPISDNQTMGDNWEDRQTRFDRVFFRWTPVEDLRLTAGKMGQPWQAVADLVMSGDANPEGLAANYALKGEVADLLAHGGAFVVKERSSADETMLYTGQAAVKFKFAEKDYLMVGGTIYSYDNVEGFELLGDPSKSFGNSSRTETDEEGVETKFYTTGYVLVEGFAEAGLTLGSIPFTAAVQYLVNTEADDDDTAYLGSLSAKLPHGFGIGYQYRYLEKDSTLGVFGESTDFGNGTDIKGHIPYVSYSISKNFGVKVQYAMGQKGLDNGKDIDTFKVDVSAKF